MKIKITTKSGREYYPQSVYPNIESLINNTMMQTGNERWINFGKVSYGQQEFELLIRKGDIESIGANYAQVIGGRRNENI